MIIAGRYELHDEIGQGGMGTVYHGVDTRTEQPVAIKSLKPEVVSRDPSLLTRFIHEGEALRQLNHPNIVKMLDAVEQDGQHYLVMEYIDGGSLRELMDNSGPMNAAQVGKIGLQVADALTRAHYLGIIHRDIKPENVLIANDDTPRLTDFGVAHIESVPDMTGTGVAIGTVHYMSPETCKNETIDTRTDIWSFGVMLFEMLAGLRPFKGEGAVAILTAILQSAPQPDLELLRPDVSIALVDLVYRMLEKDPQMRIPSVRLVGAELEALLVGRQRITPDPPPEIVTGRFDTPTSDERPKHNLPAQVTEFVGREAELLELERLLERPNSRLVTIVAPGGMGKTRLSLEVAARQLDNFERGVYFVELAPLHDPANIVSATGSAVGFQFYEGIEPKQQILDYLREKETLLVMDNFEHLLDGAELVSDILAYAPEIKVLATSRERLNLSGETVFTISGIDFPNWETPDDALEYAAVKLFMQSAQRVAPQFELQADELKYLARICRLVGGMPLGILLAAAWIEMLSLEEIAAEISSGLDLLQTDKRDVPDRHRSMRAVFDASWARLSGDEQAVLMKLTVFRGGFTRQAAQAVTGATLGHLTGLVHKSLLQRNRESGRYHIHELLRQYGAEKLADAGLETTIRDAHCTYYTNALHDLEDALKDSRQIEAADAVEADIENCWTAWGWAVETVNLEALDQAFFTLWLFCVLRNRYFSEWQPAIERAAQMDVTEPAGVWARILGTHAFFITFSPEQRKKRFEEALEIAQSVGAPEIVAEGKEALAQLSYSIGEYEIALRQFEEALAFYRSQGDRWRISSVLGQMAWLAGNELENYEQAMGYLDEALTIASERGDYLTIAAANLRLAAVIGRYDIDRSRQANRNALNLYRKINYERGIAVILNNMGFNECREDNFEQARVYLDEAVSMALDMGNTELINITLNSRSQVALLGGNYDEARGYCRDAALAWLAHPFGLRNGLSTMVSCTYLIADIHPERAVEFLARALTDPAFHPERTFMGEPLQDRLQDSLPADVFEAAWKRGKNLNLEATVREVVRLLEADE